MKFFSTADTARAASGGVHLIGVLGLGLVGGSICSELANAGARCLFSLRINWGSVEGVEKSLEQALMLTRQSVPPDHPITQFSVVWAAGKAGFHSPESAHARELEYFKRALLLREKIQEVANPEIHRFFLVSSAGGLFEGQRAVDSASLPSPLRDYGKFKLLQEENLERAAGFHSAFIYRPSTVYGHSPGGRIGLISALLLNGIRHRVSAISGSATTLRDYVFNSDVGRFIASEIMTPPTTATVTRRFLVSGKPSSIYEISRIAEDLLKRKVYLSFTLGPQNALHNTYSRSAVPVGWRPTSLREGMQAVLRAVLRAEVL